jgi:hypothetical protein
MDDDNQLAKIFRAKLLRAVSNLFEHKYKHSSIVSFFLVKKKNVLEFDRYNRLDESKNHLNDRLKYSLT